MSRKAVKITLGIIIAIALLTVVISSILCIKFGFSKYIVTLLSIVANIKNIC